PTSKIFRQKAAMKKHRGSSLSTIYNYKLFSLLIPHIPAIHRTNRELNPTNIIKCFQNWEKTSNCSYVLGSSNIKRLFFKPMETLK
ncbi:hypothetical protein L9F63_022304, partial [Diploptera punctata]